LRQILRHESGARWLRAIALTALLLPVLLLSGCTHGLANSGALGHIPDPYEKANRAIFAVNQKFNSSVTLPIAWVYVTYVPGRVRKGVHNALSNVESPVTFANDLLQGRIGEAGTTLFRLVVNSTAGLGGLVDVAAASGVPGHESGFGQTLALYGVPSGPFLVLPLIGPSTPRDVLGTAGDLVADPLFYIPSDWSLLGHAGAVVGVHTLLPLETNAGAVLLRQKLGESSVDPYATMRSAYRQQRARQIGGDDATPDIPP
jgi:phospholipid-binding lipoprotein MlaA